MDPPQNLTTSMVPSSYSGFGNAKANHDVSPKRRYLGLFVLLTIVDALQTTHIVSRYGSIAEVNPVMRWVLEHFSITGLWWIKAIVVLALLVAFDRIRPGVLLGSVALMAPIVASNMLQMWAVLQRGLPMSSL